MKRFEEIGLGQWGHTKERGIVCSKKKKKNLRKTADLQGETNQDWSRQLQLIDYVMDLTAWKILLTDS